jgi:hypothetical protein
VTSPSPTPPVIGFRTATISAEGYKPFAEGLVQRIWLLLTSTNPPQNLTAQVVQCRLTDHPGYRIRHATFKLIHAAYTSVLSIQAKQVSGFEDICLLILYDRLICDFCLSSQIVSGFLFVRMPACGLQHLRRFRTSCLLSPLRFSSFSQHLTVLTLPYG